MPEPTPLNVPDPEMWRDLAEEHQPVPAEKPAATYYPPLLRITATYAVPENSGLINHMMVEVNVDEVDGRIGEDGLESGFIRTITEAVAALRGGTPPPVANQMTFVYSDASLTTDQLVGLQDRIEAAQRIRRSRDDQAERDRRYGKQGLPPDVVAGVFARGGKIREPGADGSDEIAGNLQGCNSGLGNYGPGQPAERPYDNGASWPRAQHHVVDVGGGTHEEFLDRHRSITEQFTEPIPDDSEPSGPNQPTTSKDGK